jgi:two-component system phosphate regulon sensor histidine kinase PhoR
MNLKTPIANNNKFSLDAIKNPKIIDDKEKVFKIPSVFIKDENKRMHAQVGKRIANLKIRKRKS